VLWPVIKHPLWDSAETEHITEGILASGRVGFWWSVLCLSVLVKIFCAPGILVLTADYYFVQQA